MSVVTGYYLQTSVTANYCKLVETIRFDFVWIFYICIIQHAMLMPVLLGHLRFHLCIRQLQNEINYQFKDPQLLQVKGYTCINLCLFVSYTDLNSNANCT